jgi:hypothetical protein
VEGFANAEWILADYGDYLIHVFSPKSRTFYELERLWRHAKVVPIPEDSSPAEAHYQVSGPRPALERFNPGTYPWSATIRAVLRDLSAPECP